MPHHNDTLHNLVAKMLRLQDPQVQLKGFKQALRVAFQEEFEEWETNTVLARFNCVPDAYKIDPRNEDGVCNITVYEVEDTNPLSREKLGKFIDLWWFIDSTSRFNLELVVVDRYGNQNPIDLLTFALCELSE